MDESDFGRICHFLVNRCHHHYTTAQRSTVKRTLLPEIAPVFCEASQSSSASAAIDAPKRSHQSFHSNPNTWHTYLLRVERKVEKRPFRLAFLRPLFWVRSVRNTPERD